MLSEESKNVLAELVDVRTLLDMVPAQHLYDVVAGVTLHAGDLEFANKAHRLSQALDELRGMMPAPVSETPAEEVVEPVAVEHQENQEQNQEQNQEHQA